LSRGNGGRTLAIPAGSSMELHQVRYFLSVCRTLNFTRAAGECHVAQPSLSRAIKQLELELGGDLFRRERQLTHLTELGRAVHDSLAQCYEASLTAKELAKSYLKEGHGPLNLALSRTIDMRLLTPLLVEITGAFPRLQINLLRGARHEIAQRLRNGDAELAIAGELDDDWERFNTRKLYDEEFGLLVHRGNPLARKTQVEIDALRGQKLVFCDHCAMADRLLAKLEESDALPATRHMVPLPDDIADLVQGSSGIGVHSLLRQVPDELRLLQVHGVDLRRGIHLITVSGRQFSVGAAALVRLLRARDWSGALPSTDDAEVLH
ncbi:MAG: LysR family transcriptional regulator, partial [Pseudomonadota bacterium]|nr:LysR family transcriptional regulator [Pseudomonadota bacterium]